MFRRHSATIHGRIEENKRMQHGREKKQRQQQVKSFKSVQSI